MSQKLAALVRASFSTNIKERRDCSTALFDRRGATLCQAEHIPMHLGSFIGIIPEILKRHPAETMLPGDVFIGNDAYAGGGTHLPDIVLGEPIFIDGRIIAWAVNTAHHADFADRGHAHIYQEGLRIPPIRLYRAGELQQDVQELILLNCQVPRERLSDLRAQMAANRLGVQRMQALCRKYGTDIVLAVGDALQDYAERKMRAGIAALPDGNYRFADTYDSPELDRALPVSVAITIEGSEMRLHFESPPQVRAGINMIYTALLSSVYYAVKAVVDPTILPNSGLARPITVTAPPGTVMNAMHPAAVNGRTSTCQRAADLVIGALAQAAPERCIAAGNGSCTTASFAGINAEDGRLWVYLETIGGGSGARAGKDGLDGVHVHMTNTSNLPVEALEVEYPLTVLRYELVDGSSGAGRFRGGMGLRRIYRAEAECQLRLDGSRLLTPP
jgi:N-methylhydantoinase B